MSAHYSINMFAQELATNLVVKPLLTITFIAGAMITFHTCEITSNPLFVLGKMFLSGTVAYVATALIFKKFRPIIFVAPILLCVGNIVRFLI